MKGGGAAGRAGEAGREKEQWHSLSVQYGSSSIRTGGGPRCPFWLLNLSPFRGHGIIHLVKTGGKEGRARRARARDTHVLG